MPSFKYFFKGETRGSASKHGVISDDFLDRWKLNHLARKPLELTKDCVIDENFKGLDNAGAGLVLNFAGFGTNITATIDRDDQWLDLGDGLWIGWKEAKPAPPDLQHPEFISMGWVITSAGDWTVPVARSERAVTIPQSFVPTRDGKWETQVVDSYRDYWELSGYIEEMWNGEREIPLTEQAELALKCLQVNYRIGWSELQAMASYGQNVLTETSIARILMVCCDYDIAKLFINGDEKKNVSSSAAEGESSSTVIVENTLTPEMDSVVANLGS